MMKYALLFLAIMGIAGVVWSVNRFSSEDDVRPSSTSTELLATSQPSEDSERCIVTISGKKYDVTAFIPFHPGGADAIKKACGTDATELFFNRGSKGPHPKQAEEKLSTMEVK
ncbi:MAG TPA: hypothetical protein DCW55_04155 [Candidatus Pacebacteria bacterium]|nr:MAG: hypothetical protein A2378_01860 [Candidatus Pacebacteria bacterium RIFOXYB1_FULL_44_10]HAU99395.1 hypothetical protein [Candidatus Paceibacterota bacterium]HAX01600.1 hypothetical protein [Candidatus Paceibacterota bacterium]